MKKRARLVTRGWWVRRGLAALVLGVVTTVGVAWGIALRGADNPPRALMGYEDTAWGRMMVLEARGTGWSRRWLSGYDPEVLWTPKPWFFTLMARAMEETCDEAPEMARPAMAALQDELRTNGLGPIGTFGLDDARGWPWLALWCDAPDNGAAGWRHEDGGIVLPSVGGWRTFSPRVRVLPLRVLWAGFAGDTVLFSGVWFVGLAVWPFARRVRRLRRGRCPVCRYELVEGGCPECGWNREEKRLATGDERLGGRG